MSARVDIEEIETTKSEKLLAVVLAVFLLIGGVWTYQKIDDYVRDAVVSELPADPEDRAVLERAEQARSRVFQAEQDVAQARQDLEIRREAYRTALDAGQPTAELERAYRQAEARFERAETRLDEAHEELRAVGPAATAVERRQGREFEESRERYELYAFLLRLALVAALIAYGYWLLGRLRRRNSRYLPVGLAFVGFSSVMALILATDYITDYIDPFDLGPLVLSLFGIVVTLAAFAALQRYLARRLPFRRVRKRECPFCGYPVRENARCEGCGREVVADCATCGNSRRVGTLHCGVCGQA